MATKPVGIVDEGTEQFESTNGGTEWPDSIEVDGDTIPTIEPESIPQQSGSGTGKRKRGRPAGSGSGQRKTSKENKNDLGSLLQGLHFMAAKITSIAELELDDDEAKKLGAAVAKVNDYYGGMAIPEWVEVWSGFAMAAGAIYVPRVIAYSNRVKQETRVENAKKGTVVQGQVM